MTKTNPKETCANDYPFNEWAEEKPVKGKPLDSEGAESSEELNND